MRKFDVIIVGGGASGLMCAINVKAKARNVSVAVLEKKEKVGRKLQATGNGKCNLTNMDCPGVAKVIDFFSNIGVPVRTDEEGRVYPYSEDAGQVANALKERAESLGVEIFTSTPVSGISVSSDGSFDVRPGFSCDNLVIATGGKSCANFGTTGDGYIFARDLGHRINPLIPGLTAIEVEENIQYLKGVRSKGIAALYKNGRPVASEKGEIQFREDALSGILIMNLSNLVRRDGKYNLVLNLVPDFPKASLDDIYGAKALLKPELMRYIKEKNIDPRRMVFTVSGLKGWSEAQITCGGVSLDDVDAQTMESEIVKNLYFTGEILDIQEPCGGYNLNNAWLTGMTAADAISDKYF